MPLMSGEYQVFPCLSGSQLHQSGPIYPQWPPNLPLWRANWPSWATQLKFGASNVSYMSNSKIMNWPKFLVPNPQSGPYLVNALGLNSTFIIYTFKTWGTESWLNKSYENHELTKLFSLQSPIRPMFLC